MCQACTSKTELEYKAAEGFYGVVMICHCKAQHIPMYCAKNVSRPDAEKIASDLALRNGHDFMIVTINGLR